MKNSIRHNTGDIFPAQLEVQAMSVYQHTSTDTKQEQQNITNEHTGYLWKWK